MQSEVQSWQKNNLRRENQSSLQIVVNPACDWLRRTNACKYNGKFNSANVAFECNMQPSASIRSPNFVHVIIINHCTSLWNIVRQNWVYILIHLFPFGTLVRNIEKKGLLSSEQTFPTVFHLNNSSPRVCLWKSNLPFRPRRATATTCKFLVKNACLIVLNWIELNWIELNWIELNWIELNLQCWGIHFSIISVPRALFL